jgi:hypothetical protein
MRRQLTGVVLSATLAVIAGGTLLSGQDHSETGKIPFSFEAQGKLMPAGNYTIIDYDNSNDVYQLRSSTGQSIYWMADVERKADPANPELTFVKGGNEYVLASVGMPGSTVSHGISDARVQKTFSRSMGITSLVAVPLHSR